MGSLPNLHELEEAERKREKRRERELLREQLREHQRARESSSRDRERLALFTRKNQSSYNAYLMAGLGNLGGGGVAFGMAAAAAAAAAAGTSHMSTTAATATAATLPPTAGATTTAAAGAAAAAATGGGGGSGIGGSAALNSAAAAVAAGAAATASSTLGTFAMGGAALLGLGATGVMISANSKHHHQHQRHSLTSRHRVMRTRSSGAAHNLWDEQQLMEHLAAYSPASTRSHRINPVSSYQVQAALAASRRRESVNSSIGATSIRRLLTLNNRNCRHKVAPHVRQKVCKNYTFHTIAHGLMCSVMLPIVGLQGSNSVWHHRERWLKVGSNMGSMLLSGCFLIAAVVSIITPRLIRKFGYSLLIGANYVSVSLFLLSHLYPSIFTLLPAYVLLGVTLCPSWVSKIALVVHFGNRLSCSQHECTLSTSHGHGMDTLDEHRLFCNRDQKVRRLARWFQAAKDLGIILGALIASMILACTPSDWNCLDANAGESGETVTIINPTTANISHVNVGGMTMAIAPTDIAVLPTPQPFQVFPNRMTNFWPQANGYFDDFYNLNEHGERICGADMCPIWRVHEADEVLTTPGGTNETLLAHIINGKSRSGGLTLIGIYFAISLISILLTIFVGKIQTTFRYERSKGVTDSVLFAAPMAYFIGSEQAYMLGDFLRAFVSCSLGISMVAGALIGMGIMQSIVSCTLSMLLRHTKRIAVILAACFFQSCLLLALSRWKPSSDDSALFYVLAASWGACNGMWETLLLALITINHSNHVVEVTSPLQGMRFLGLAVTFAAHGLVCETPKIIVLGVGLVFSVPPYTFLEMRLEAQRKAHMINL